MWLLCEAHWVLLQSGTVGLYCRPPRTHWHLHSSLMLFGVAVIEGSRPVCWLQFTYRDLSCGRLCCRFYLMLCFMIPFLTYKRHGVFWCARWRSRPLVSPSSLADVFLARVFSWPLPDYEMTPPFRLFDTRCSHSPVSRASTDSPMNKSFFGSCCHLDSSPSLPLLLRFASACYHTPFHLGVGWVVSADTVAVCFLLGTYPFSTVSVRQSPYIFLLASITSLSLYRYSSRCFFGFFCRSSAWTCFLLLCGLHTPRV